MDGPDLVSPIYYWAYDLQCPPNQQFNATLVCIPQADALMKQVETTTNPSTAQSLLNQVDRLYYNDAPRIWMWLPQLVYVINRQMKTVYASNLPEMRYWSK